MSTKVPLTPAALRIPAAVLTPCSVIAKRLGSASELLVELLVPLDAELAGAVEGVEEPDAAEEPEDGAVGWKPAFPTPKPMAVASVPLPTIAIESLSFRLVITSWPLAFSDAVTCALVGRSMLMALIRSPTVSVPVDV